jgi:hypothetical protein
MTATYSFDSSAFIDPFRRHYPPDLFPAFWEALATRIETGAIVASQVVRDEIEQKDDDLLAWVKRRSNLFVPMDEPQQDRLVEILTRFPTWVDPASSKNQADPFVVALARARSLTVVINESGGSDVHPKIPFVCKHYQIRHLRVLAFMREIGWRFEAA